MAKRYFIVGNLLREKSYNSGGGMILIRINKRRRYMN
jgi:hypothetical protein